MTGEEPYQRFTLDRAGDEVVAAWLDTYPDAQAIAKVVDLLEKVGRGEPISDWYRHGDDLGSIAKGDHLVELRPGLLVAIRIYSDEDPEHMYSVVWIIDDAPQDGSPDCL